MGLSALLATRLHLRARIEEDKHLKMTKSFRRKVVIYFAKLSVEERRTFNWKPVGNSVFGVIGSGRGHSCQGCRLS